MKCEYDGTTLPEADGVPDACPTCEADIAAHLATCSFCSVAPNLPEAGGLDMAAYAGSNPSPQRTGGASLA